jgi:hypothetical protein
MSAVVGRLERARTSRLRSSFEREHAEREGDDEEPYDERDRRGTEESVAPRRVDDQRNEESIKNRVLKPAMRLGSRGKRPASTDCTARCFPPLAKRTSSAAPTFLCSR